MSIFLTCTASGANFAEILEEYEGLSPEDVRACILFASKSLSNTTFMPLAVENTWMRFLVDECTGSVVAR
ncbi:DUF433 domain-containing protein [Scytonema sp. NUACC26]|uniref:DUF433 domain-containing protein n=1 Tax=Scytonema sp. NUACC26 TaxID=3140176 RepID=UPI0038B2913F